MVLAAVLFVGGGLFALRAYSRTSGPAGAVKGYFAALQRGDAPAALGFGLLPPGPRTLLTTNVLRAQQQEAPITDVRVGTVNSAGGRATVSVSYSLGFSSGIRVVDDRVIVVHQGRNWRLAQAAVATRLVLQQAASRATILDAAVPTGTVLMFPGAVPIIFNTSLLQLAVSTSSVLLDGGGQTKLVVQVSSSGQSAVLAAVTSALQACLAPPAGARPALTCPLPSDRYVPGSLRGQFPQSDIAKLTLGVSDQSSGVIEIDAASVTVTDASYTILDANNQPKTGAGTVSLPITATIYPTYPSSPLVVHWSGGNQ